MQQPAKTNSAEKAFTQNWLQSLTLVAQNPVARQIKPLLDCVNDLTRMNSEGDRLASAHKLWDYATAEGLKGLLDVLPIQQPDWRFDRDETFVYQRASLDPIPDFATWSKCIGVTAGEFALFAEVTSSDWLTFVRQEAVRLQKPMNTAAMPQGMNLRLPCTARWDLQNWSIHFDQADWIVNRYTEPFTVQRPSIDSIDESLFWMFASANDNLIPKTVPKCSGEVVDQGWMACVSRLESLHQRVLVKEAKLLTPWFRRTWACVWPVVYREQNVLRGQAQIDVVRQEVAACIGSVPRLTSWMFVMAKLLCECQLGRGVGASADYAVG